MEYGSDEHLDGLSHNALKTEVRWWHDRATEMEGECERLQAENAKLRELVRAMATRLAHADRVVDGGVFDARLRREVAKLGVEVGR